MSNQNTKNIIAAGAGAIIMLISLAFPWYAASLFGNSFDISISDLLTQTGEGGFVWVGSAFPIILVILFASLAFLFTIYSLLEGKENTKFLYWLGILSAISIIVNAVYVLYWMYDNYQEWVYIINPGVILAFVGASVMILGHPEFRKAISEPGRILRTVGGKLDDWFTNQFEDPAQATRIKGSFKKVEARIRK